MAKYRKTALIEAYQFPFAEDVPQEFKDAVVLTGQLESFPPVDVYGIHTLEGTHEVVQGAWVAKGIQGEFWIAQNSIFKATYEQVEA